MQRLLDSLPEGFDFYHLGRIERSDSPLAGPDLGRAQVSDDRASIAYAIQGEESCLIVLRFDGALDRSMYAEAGNILASQFVADLERRRGVIAVLSPPRELTPRQLGRLLADPGADTAEPRLTRHYLHRLTDGSSVRLDAVILPASTDSTEGTGNA